MSEHSQHKPTGQGIPGTTRSGASSAIRKLTCEEWEAMLVDFLDGTLPASDLESFHAHLQSPPSLAPGAAEQNCAPCSEMFSQARQGREWLSFLRSDPAVPPTLISKILAQTSGAAVPAALAGDAVPALAAPIPIAQAAPFWRSDAIVSVGRRVAQPRLLMTAAMAFFSITLTLNMAGVRLTTVRLSDLKPSTLTSNLDKQYRIASARVVRYYDNLSFVYKMEVNVRDLRRDADLDNGAPNSPAPPPTNGAPQENKPKNGGKSEGPSAEQPQARLWGERVEAVLRNSFGSVPGLAPFHQALQPGTKYESQENETIAADQAERGIA